MNSNSRFPLRTLVSRCGFTLVELLVVILIVVTLASLTFTLTTRMRAQGGMITDIGRLKEIGTLLGLFEADHNGCFPCEKDSAGSGTSDFNFPESLDRYLPPAPQFNPGGKYNFQYRDPVLLSGLGARAYPGWNPQSSYPNFKGPWAFGVNKYLSVSYNWRGIMSQVPDRSRIVVVSCMNSAGGYNMDPDAKAVFEDNVKTPYRVSYPGRKWLYLFCDFRVEPLSGDRGTAYYKAHPNETNIWRWW
jgi:prepilin-type N-terminal cleavage/methylation domain-containing protein